MASLKCSIIYYNKAYKEQHDGDGHELITPHVAIIRKKVKKKKVLKDNFKLPIVFTITNTKLQSYFIK